MSLTPQNMQNPEPFHISVPECDNPMDIFCFGNVTIPVYRSVYDPTTGTSTSNPRQQLNLITSYLDGSQIYGSDSNRNSALRTFSGGELKTSGNGLFAPINVDSLNMQRIPG